MLCRQKYLKLQWFRFTASAELNNHFSWVLLQAVTGALLQSFISKAWHLKRYKVLLASTTGAKLQLWQTLKTSQDALPMALEAGEATRDIPPHLLSFNFEMHSAQRLQIKAHLDFVWLQSWKKNSGMWGFYSEVELLKQSHWNRNQVNLLSSLKYYKNYL